MRKEKLQYIILLFYAFVFLKYYLSSLSNVLTIGYIAVGYYALLKAFIKSIYPARVIKWTVFIILLGVINFIVSSFFTSNFRYQDLLLLFPYMGVALIPFGIKLNYKLFKWFFVILICFFSFYALRGIDANEIFSISRNFVSVLLLIGASYHIISAYQNGKKISLLLILLSLVIAIWTSGRSGIIVFSLLTLSIIFFDPTYKKFRIGYAFMLIVGAFIAYTYLYTDLISEGLSRFSNYGVEDTARSSVNASYLKELNDNLIYLLVGAPLDQIAAIVLLDLNPHNSIIRLHVFYGLAGVAIVAWLFFRSGVYLIRQRNYIFLFLLLCLLMRSYVDSTSFHGPLDPIIYYLLFQFLETSFSIGKRKVI